MIMKLEENIMRQSLECQEYPPPPHHPLQPFISSFKIKFKEIIFVFPPVFYHGNGFRISFGLIADYDWSFIQRWLTIWSSMTHGTANEDIWRMIIGGFPLVLLYDSFTFLTWHILLPFKLIFSHHYKLHSISSYFWLTYPCLADSLIHHCFLFCTSCSCALSFNWLSFSPSILHCLALL